MVSDPNLASLTSSMPLAKTRRNARPVAGHRPVLLVTPGGLEERGGMGRLLTSVDRYWREAGGGPPTRVVDTYGTGTLWQAPVHFAWALAAIAWQALSRRAAGDEAPLLHVHMATWGSVVRKGLVIALGHRLGLPILLHLHGGDLDVYYRQLSPAGRRRVQRLMRRADRIVVLGDYWRRVLVEEIGIEAERVVVLLNATGGPAAAIERPPGRRPCRLLFLGRLEPEKGLPELLEALADPRLAGLDWHVRAAGGGDLAAWRARADALGIPPDRLDLPGWADEAQVRRWLAESDVFVLPSHYEGLSIAVLEALAFGLAVVTTPVGVTAEAIDDGETGLLVPPGDVPALAAALARVIQDEDLRVALQQGARRRFLERFDIAVYCARLEALYRDTVAAAQCRPLGRSAP